MSIALPLFSYLESQYFIPIGIKFYVRFIIVIIHSSFIAMLMINCVVCSFCGQDFITLGRHSWRYKQQINPAEEDRTQSSTRDMPVMQSPNVPVSSRTLVKCWCGFICKRRTALKCISAVVKYYMAQ